MVYLDYVELFQILSICRKQTSPFAFNLLNLAHLIEINVNSKEICHWTSNFHLQHFKSHCQSTHHSHAWMYVIILTFSPATILQPTLLFSFFYNFWNSKYQHLLIREYLSSVFLHKHLQSLMITAISLAMYDWKFLHQKHLNCNCKHLFCFCILHFLFFDLTCKKQDNLDFARSCCFELPHFLWQIELVFHFSNFKNLFLADPLLFSCPVLSFLANKSDSEACSACF